MHAHTGSESESASGDKSDLSGVAASDIGVCAESTNMPTIDGLIESKCLKLYHVNDKTKHYSSCEVCSKGGTLVFFSFYNLT